MSGKASGTHLFEKTSTYRPPAEDSPGHDFVEGPSDGLLYCTRCPMVAYDLADAATEPECPLPLESWSA